MDHMEGVVAILIPIIMFLVIGIILVTFIYFRSRERQMLIDKGLDAQSIKEYFAHKRDPNRLIKIGLVILFFGLGLGLGLILNDVTSKEYWVPLLLFVFTGVGFIIANKYSIKAEE